MVFAHFIGNIFDMSLDLYGCRVIQCIFERGTPNQRQQIFEEISGNPRHLIEHRYGNYVIQFALRKYNQLIHVDISVQMIIFTKCFHYDRIWFDFGNECVDR